MDTRNFEIFWSDLTYQIAPSTSNYNVLSRFEQPARKFSESILGSHKRRSYDLTNDQPRKEAMTILRNVNGSFRSGELTAVMGPSGAGKTSLLNLIARRREKGYSGKLTIRDRYHRVRVSGIPQESHLPPYLTVKENLLFASRLKNLAKDFDHEHVVAEVSRALDLDRCLYTMTSKISGGQQKRVSIAQELVSNLDILVLDEPTSGLDSLTCWRTLELLRNLVRSSASSSNPIAVLLSIHQPEHNVYDIFDKIYVLALGGLAIYNGHPQECTKFIKKHTGLQLPTSDYNPASFMIEIASNEYGSKPIEALRQQVTFEFESTKASNSYVDVYKKRHLLETKLCFYEIDLMTEKCGDFNDKGSKSSLDIDERIIRGSTADHHHFWSKTFILAHRYYISLIRDPKQMLTSLAIHLMLPLAMAFILGTAPGQANNCPRLITHYDLKGMATNDSLVSKEVLEEQLLGFENSGTMFLLIYSLIVTCAGTASLSFTMDMQSTLKEHHNGWYSMISYIIARIVTDLPFSIILPTITTCAAFYLTGQASGGSLDFIDRALLASVSTVLGSIAGKLVGMIFGAVYMGQVISSLFASQASLMPLILLSGFSSRLKNMKPIMQMLSNISFIKHGLNVVLLARYGFDMCRCKSDSIKPVEVTGVSDDLKTFTQYLLDTIYDEEAQTNSNSSDSQPREDTDLFQLFAEQISLYNANGIKVSSCKDVIPHQLFDSSLNDEDLLPILLYYSITVVAMTLLLLITVQLVARSKTSV